MKIHRNLQSFTIEIHGLLFCREQFDLHVSLADFVHPDKKSVVALLLDWCTNPETEFPSLIEGFLADYLRRHGLDADLVFR